MRLSFSPASIKGPSGRIGVHSPYSVLERILVELALLLLEVAERLATLVHRELDEGIARTGGRRGP